MYTFSYYMSSIETTHETDDMVSGNFAAGARNPYLHILIGDGLKTL